MNMAIIIPFGYDCIPAQILEDGGIRTQSMPFDWIFASPKSIKDALDNRFENWFDSNKIKHVIRQEDGHSYTSHEDYPIPDIDGLSRGIFNHHNLTDPKTVAAFNRRIKRFYEAIKSNESIVFFTCSTKQDLLDSGLLDYFDRSAETSFIFLDWVYSKENIINIEQESSYIKIQYHYENRRNENTLSPAICNIIKDLFVI